MNKSRNILSVLALGTAFFAATACGGPKGDDNSTDADNGVKEGAVDSTKMPEFGAGKQADTISMGDTTQNRRDTTTNSPR